MRAAALAALCIVMLGCNATTPSAVVSTGPASSVRTAPVISPPPVTPPNPPGTNLPAFTCTDVSGGTPGRASVTAVRVGEDPAYDRFVLQFDSTVPAYTVKRQARPVFAQGASGQTITLSGTSGAIIQLHTASQAGSYTGQSDFTQASYRVIKEARLTQDFEGTVSWGLGLGSAAACIRVFTLADPARLVVDFSSTSP